jgi:hypothetical protein
MPATCLAHLSHLTSSTTSETWLKGRRRPVSHGLTERLVPSEEVAEVQAAALHLDGPLDIPHGEALLTAPSVQLQRCVRMRRDAR